MWSEKKLWESNDEYLRMLTQSVEEFLKITKLEEPRQAEYGLFSSVEKIQEIQWQQREEIILETTTFQIMILQLSFVLKYLCQ